MATDVQAALLSFALPPPKKKYPPGFQSKPLFSEVLPDGVFRSLLERLPLSPDGRFVIVLLVAVGFVICKVAL